MFDNWCLYLPCILYLDYSLYLKKMPKNKLILIVVLVFLVGAIIAYSLLRTKTLNQQSEITPSIDWSKESFSRVSFFNASRERASMEMPQAWEGKYRIKEEGNRVTFLYLQPDATTLEMFAIEKREARKDDKDMLCQKGTSGFFIIDPGFDDKSGLESYRSAFNLILKSFKCS